MYKLLYIVAFISIVYSTSMVVWRYLYYTVYILYIHMQVLKKLSRQHLVSHVLPVVMSLKHLLEQRKSPLQVCNNYYQYTVCLFAYIFDVLYTIAFMNMNTQ